MHRENFKVNILNQAKLSFQKSLGFQTCCVFERGRKYVINSYFGLLLDESNNKLHSRCKSAIFAKVLKKSFKKHTLSAQRRFFHTKNLTLSIKTFAFCIL